MSESKQRKGTSVAAFMFLPQWKYCFEGMAHIVPVFMRTLALMFASAGIIDRDHPATRYGIAGVRKFGFRDLMGEGWYTLRNTKATVYQWGLYLSVIMMIGLMLGSVLTFTASAALSVTSDARAQIFTHPGTPYGAPGETGLDVVPSTPGANKLFDTRYIRNINEINNPTSTDYALMVLDKVLRSGAKSGPQAAATQEALGSLMSVYNNGVLVVAAIMLFWMIITIVVDTAKTGQIGGGRHNMVWAPIRVVFALGLMIPLGTSGFSSGQFMVMKLAEWGSNFGTKGWSAYIDGVLENDNLISVKSKKGAWNMAAGIAKIKSCQLAYNAYEFESNPDFSNAVGSTTFDQINDPRAIRISSDYDFITGIRTISYTNNVQKSTCGTITVKTGVALSDPNIKATNFLLGFGFTALAAIGNTISKATDAVALQVFSEYQGGGSKLSSPHGSNVLFDNARQFACGFVRRYYKDGGNANDNPTNSLCNGISYNACYLTGDTAAQGGTAQGESNGVVPTTTNFGMGPLTSPAGGGYTKTLDPDTEDPGLVCHQNMVNEIQDAMQLSLASFETAWDQALITEMQANLHARGWAGMGLWYGELVTINRMAASVAEMPASFSPGTIWSAKKKGGIEEKVASIMQRYGNWWEKTKGESVPQGSINERTKDRPKATPDVESESDGMKDSFDGDSDGKGLMNKVAGWIVNADDDNFVFNVIDGEDDPVYPMTQLANTGSNILATGVAALAMLSLIQAAIGGVEVGWSLGIFSGSWHGAAFAESGIMSGAFTISMTLIVCGIMLSFWLPAMPLIRVAFAVVTWIISVFEAVCMVPIAALSFLTTGGEGIGGDKVWPLWLNILLRPILVVLGFVGAMLVYNTFIIYFHIVFAQFVVQSTVNLNFIEVMISHVVYSIIYVAVMYTAANMIFKMLDLVPNGLIRWLGGSVDHSFDADGGAESMMLAGSNMLSKMGGGKSSVGFGKDDDDDGESSGVDGGDGGGGGGGGGGPKKGKWKNITSGGGLKMRRNPRG